MHIYVDQETLYKKCKFHVPRGKGSMARPKWLYCINEYNVLKNTFLGLLTLISNKKRRHNKKEHKALYQN